MRRTLALLLSCALALGLLSGCGGGAPVPLSSDCSSPLPPSQPWSSGKKLSINPSDSETVYTALSGFGLALLQQSRQSGGGSNLISPLSVALALSMAANGAEGDTLAQFQAVLGGGADLVELNAACAQLMSDYQGLPGSTRCTIANSLWANPWAELYEEFVAKCRGYYSAQVYEAELSEERIVGDLNRWVSDHTGKLIPKIIDQPFDRATVCLLVNALYLKNTWLLEFDPLCTREMDFFHGDASVSRVDCLQHFDTTLSYLKDDTAQGVLLPYDDGRLAFFALMPDLDAGGAPPDFGGWLSALTTSDLPWLLTTREDAMFLRFAMPKFTAEWTGQLQQILPALGLADAFDPDTADFSALGSSPEGYYLSQVIHAAKIDVNEKGTEAAAATIAAASGGAAPPAQGITLVLDRPFLYGIVDLDTGVPVFLGTYE